MRLWKDDAKDVMMKEMLILVKKIIKLKMEIVLIKVRDMLPGDPTFAMVTIAPAMISLTTK